MPNRLASETSPYLLQHAENPVDWYPWGEEALERARSEGKPILLSIGYSACHWCHVMERESFGDPEIAALMNRTFVNIKVDREERPDLDSIYMRSVQAMTGQGGWPLTTFLTPDGKPFYGGTYFPPEPRHGMPSFKQVLEAASGAFHDRRKEVEKSAEELVGILSRAGEVATDRLSKDGSTLDRGAPVASLDGAVAFQRRLYDPIHGGFGNSPKFPQPVLLEFLLQAHHRTGDPSLLEMTAHTLEKMYRGGMYDHLGGGFHRYSVDAHWFVPHFEKMLYDNALLARVYMSAFQLTGTGLFRQAAEETLDYVLEDLRSPEGGFYSARDADSEGEEGLFYTWTVEEVAAVIAPEEAELFRRVYDVSRVGNFEGRNILHLPHDLSAVARDADITLPELDRRLSKSRAVLKAARVKRVHPLRDDKVLASWNGMTIRTLAEAGRVLERTDYLAAAVSAMDFLLGALQSEGRLLRTYTAGQAKIPGFLEDYAAVSNALLTLHETTLEAHWLVEARRMVESMVEQFWDEERRLFFDTAHDGEALVVRPRDVMDNATPSGNSLACEALLRLATLTDHGRFREIAEAVFQKEEEGLKQFPGAFGRLLTCLERFASPPLEIVILGHPQDPRTEALLNEAHRPYLPAKVVTGGQPGALDLPILEWKELQGGRPAAFVCERYVCQTPVMEPEALREQLGSK